MKKSAFALMLLMTFSTFATTYRGMDSNGNKCGVDVVAVDESTLEVTLRTSQAIHQAVIERGVEIFKFRRISTEAKISMDDARPLSFSMKDAKFKFKKSELTCVLN